MPSTTLYSSALGTAIEAELANARLRYYDIGEGPTVVFVHGFMANANTWRNVVPLVAAAGRRCIAVDLPLGSHSIPAPEADLSPRGVADLLEEFLEYLNLTDVTIVANDSGGVVTQLLMVRRPERVAKVVLGGVDCYEVFPPKRYDWLVPAVRIPGVSRAVIEAMRIRPLQRLPFTFGPATKRPIPPDVMDSFLLPSRNNAAIRDDLKRFLLTVNNSWTQEAAEALPTVTIPVLIAWAREDKLVPAEYARRLSRDIPNARLEFIDDAHMLLQEDQPEALADLIIDFTDA